jgi:hypothetical protein
MNVPESGTQIPIWDFETLTPAPAQVVKDRPRLKPAPADTERTRRSSAAGTDDKYCHILVGSPPYRYTSCGLRLRPPLPIEQTHRKPPCPNGNPPCPECVRVRAEETDA